MAEGLFHFAGLKRAAQSERLARQSRLNIIFITHRNRTRPYSVNTGDVSVIAPQVRSRSSGIEWRITASFEI